MGRGFLVIVIVAALIGGISSTVLASEGEDDPSSCRLVPGVMVINVLPEAFAQNRERLVRFEREAKTLATLDHPNTWAVHGLQEGDGTRFLVMQLVEGETLADGLGWGQLTVREPLPIFVQIAEALEAAHEEGIIHRDPKPANIKMAEDGTVKVLDFALAPRRTCHELSLWLRRSR